MFASPRRGAATSRSREVRWREDETARTAVVKRFVARGNSRCSCQRIRRPASEPELVTVLAASVDRWAGADGGNPAGVTDATADQPRSERASEPADNVASRLMTPGNSENCRSASSAMLPYFRSKRILVAHSCFFLLNDAFLYYVTN